MLVSQSQAVQAQVRKQQNQQAQRKPQKLTAKRRTPQEHPDPGQQLKNLSCRQMIL